MSTPESLQALRRANPRGKAGFAESVEAAADALHARMVTTPGDAAAPTPRGGRSRPRRRLLGVSTAAVSLVAAVAAAFLTVSSPGVPSAAAAVRKAATVTAASAERSGTAVVRITHDGKLWAGTTVRWHDRDVEISRGYPRRPGPASKQLVVDGIMYAYGGPHRAGWVKLGDPRSIDPGSGTTPDEYLAAVREDVGGATLRRISDGMTGLTTRQLHDGATVYSGTVAAGLIARKTGFKEGHAIRVLPFGFVAHDEAADPASPLQVSVTVGADGIFRQITVTWGTSAAWNYTVAYSRLGTTPALVAPKNARTLREVLRTA